MSKYLLDKFLFTIDRDPVLVERYRADPVGTVAWWEASLAGRILNVAEDEAGTRRTFSEDERRALLEHDYVALFELGAHPFLTLTLFIALFQRDHLAPLAFEKAYAAALAHISLPYPDTST
jgi:hypothetical protein